MCAAYLFTLLERLKSSFLSLLRVQFHTIHTCLNLILYISILLLYANFSIFHLNLKSISAHNYMKISLLRAYISSHTFDVI